MTEGLPQIGAPLTCDHRAYVLQQSRWHFELASRQAPDAPIAPILLLKIGAKATRVCS